MLNSKGELNKSRALNRSPQFIARPLVAPVCSHSQKSSFALSKVCAGGVNVFTDAN